MSVHTKAARELEKLYRTKERGTRHMTVLALLEERRDKFALLVQRIEAVVPGAHRPVSDEEAGLRGPGLVHDFTRRYASTALDWCRKAIRHGLET